MHEWSIAESVGVTLSKLREKHSPAEILEVVLTIGELMRLNGEALIEALKNLPGETWLRDVKFRFEVEAASFKCRKCDHVWGLSEAKSALNNLSGEEGIMEENSFESSEHLSLELLHAYLHCPSCGSVDIKVLKGGDIKISKIQLKE